MATLSTANTDSDTAKGECNCGRNSHGNSWIFAIAVLLLQQILEAMLLESFHWMPIGEIPVLILWGEHAYLECNHSKLKKSKNHFIFLCKLVCCFVNQWLEARGCHGLANSLALGLYFWTVILISWYFIHRMNATASKLVSQEGHLVLTSKLWIIIWCSHRINPLISQSSC